MAASIIFDQVGLPAGTGGARTDGLDTGAKVTVRNASGKPCVVQLLWVPPEDTNAVASLTQTAGDTWTFDPLALCRGSYRVRLIEDYGLSTQTTTEKIFGIRLPGTGVLIPALNEGGDRSVSLASTPDQVNAAIAITDNDEPIAGLRWLGWWRAIRDLMLAFEAVVSGSAYLTMASLRLDAPVNNKRVVSLSYSTPLDQGGGSWLGVTGAAPGTYTHNGGTVVVPSGGNGSAAWVRQYSGPVAVEWFGATGNGTTNDAAAIQAAINVLGTAGGTVIFRLGRTYRIATTIDMKSRFRVRLAAQGALIKIDAALGSGSAFDLQSAKYCKVENCRVLVDEAFAGVVFDLRGQLAPAPYTDTQYCRLRGIDLEGTGALGTWDGVAVALGGAVNCSLKDCSLVGGAHQLTGAEETDDPARRGYANVISVQNVTFANHDGYSVLNLGEAWEFSSCTFAHSSGGLARAITHTAAANAYSLNIRGCWFGDVQDIGGSGDWIDLYRTLGIEWVGNFSYAPNGSSLRVREGCGGVVVSGGQMGGVGGYGVRFTPAAGVIVGVEISGTNITAATPIEGLNSCILYRVQSINGVANVSYANNFTQESTQINDAYLYVGPKLSGLSSNQLSAVVALAYGGGFANGSLALFPSTHSSQDGEVHIGTRDGSNAPTTRIKVHRTYVDLPNASPFGLTSYTVATLPSAVTHAGRIVHTSNGDSGVSGILYSDGTNWRSIRTGVIASTTVLPNNATLGATPTFDWNTGATQAGTLTANATFAFTAPQTTKRLVLRITQDTTPRTITWPASVKWAGGVAPTISVGSGAIDVFAFEYDGANYYGQVIALNAS